MKTKHTNVPEADMLLNRIFVFFYAEFFLKLFNNQM